ncbi:MAG: hypothetical protein ACRCTQ_05115 [Brevinemataceae bacterium]
MYIIYILSIFFSSVLHAVSYNPGIGIYGATKGDNLDIGVSTYHIISAKDQNSVILNVGGGYLAGFPAMEAQGELLLGFGYIKNKIVLPIPIKRIKVISVGFTFDMSQRFSKSNYYGMTLAPTMLLGFNRIFFGVSLGYQYDHAGLNFISKHGLFGRVSLFYLFGKWS